MQNYKSSCYHTWCCYLVNVVSILSILSITISNSIQFNSILRIIYFISYIHLCRVCAWMHQWHPLIVPTWKGGEKATDVSANG